LSPYGGLLTNQNVTYLGQSSGDLKVKVRMLGKMLRLLAVFTPISSAQASTIYLDCDLPATAAVTLHANVVLDEDAKTASFTVRESSAIWTNKPALFLPSEIKVDLGYDGVRRRAIIINRQTLGLTWEAVEDGKKPQRLQGQCKLSEQPKRQI